ncbi:MAG: chemotaxis-specific protein-glutamate methyltransferase CheB [Cyanobacteriota bacterium]|nr:chemotaxis-specific protein-glutamate methyltransferase CheB [Cyanobacteriota bacterium]
MIINNNPKIIKILIVEDSPVATIVLKRIFAPSAEIEVVGTATNGLEALELIPTLDPDVICTDLHMAKMNGIEFTREVMLKFPRPILVISASVQKKDTANVFKLLEAGAVDVFPKPETGLQSDNDRLGKELINKVKILSGVKVFTLHRNRINYQEQKQLEIDRQTIKITPLERLTKADAKPSSPLVTPSPLSSRIEVVAIGASTGGPQALQTILTELPANFPVPGICVQHISQGFLEGLVSWLDSRSRVKVKIASAGELLQAGVIYFPPEGHHLEVNSSGRCVCPAAPPVGGHRPSITVTFNSVARQYGSKAAGVLLTGMGRDGADGMLAIAGAGGWTVAQNEATSIVFGMPKEAIALGAAQHILPITAIAPLLISKVRE